MPSEPRPVILTREGEDNAELARILRDRGFPVLEWPAVATERCLPEGGAAALEAACDRAEALAFTSRRALWAALEILGAPALAAVLGRAQIFAVGAATAQVLRARGAEPEAADGSGSEALAELVTSRLPAAARILLLRSVAADQQLPRALEAAGMRVEDLRLHGPGRPEPRREAPRPLAAVVCASPTAARRILAWNPWAAASAFVAIGPSTARSLRDEHGIARIVVAASPSATALAAAVEEAAGPPPETPT